MLLQPVTLALAALAGSSLAGGCGEPPSTEGPDAGLDAPSPVDADACVIPDLDAPWLGPYLDEVVGTLAAAPRATTTQRTAARAYLQGALSALGLMPQLHAFANGANVYAEISATRGTEPGVIVGAHFDTVMGSPGANDNASGVAVVLAVARVLVDTPCRTRPVTVVLFDLEETGLFGSRAFAMTRAPSSVQSVHTVDQVAWDADDDRVIELEQPAPALEAAYRAAAQRLGAGISVTTTGGTDHVPFRDRGFVAIGITEEYVGGDTSPHRHQPSDTPATVDRAYLALSTRLVASVILEAVRP